jgi:RNA polymerase sigma factor (sigma-70 family)
MRRPYPTPVEASAQTTHAALGLRTPAPMLRLQSDERLVALVRRGHHGAFEALVARYQSRLLAFCRHMLGSREDAEDVLQEVFAASYNAMLADDRPINVRPWLYRIARNRSLNHLRRTQAIGVDSMDIHLSENGATTADKVHRREDFRQLIGDVQQLAETQRTALLLREIDALSYEQIAEAMETTVPSVKSLLVRARVSLAEAAEARKLTCEEVRDELGEVAEGLRRTSPPVRRHLRTCDRCAAFRKQLRSTNRALALVFPVAPLLLFKKGLLAQLGMTASAGAGTAATGVAASASAAGGASMMSAGISTIATKAAASVAAAAIVTAGAVEVDHVRHAKPDTAPVAAVVAPPAPVPAPPKVVTPAPEPVVVASSRQPADEPKAGAAGDRKDGEKPAAGDAPETTAPAGGAPAPADGTTVALAPTQQGADSVTLPGQPTPPPPGAGGMPGPAEVAAATPPVATPAAPAVPTTPETPPVVADPAATTPAVPVETTPEDPPAPVEPTTPADPPAATTPAPDPAADATGPETPAPTAIQPPAPDPVATPATPVVP